MNNQLLERVITLNNEPCPEFVYSNPLLDRNVASACAKSFVKILRMSTQNSNINNNLRMSILENIRKMCTVEPDEHLKIDDNVTELLSDLYNDHIKYSKSELKSADKQLDAYLVRQMKALNLTSSCESSVNAEVLQALINLNENNVSLDILSKDIIHWKSSGKYINVLKDLWNSNTARIEDILIDDISIKLKSEIEKLLLDICYQVLSNRETNINEIFDSNNSIINLIKRCSVSSQCFQICISILNVLFIMTNFDLQLRLFISSFVAKVKENCPLITFSVLYPIHLNHIVVLLDFELDILPNELLSQYVQPALKYLSRLHEQSENDLIMLLSHFPNWFDIYFKPVESGELS